MSHMTDKDIQYAGSDTRPPMLDRTDFESWQQRILTFKYTKRPSTDSTTQITDTKDIWNNVKMILEVIYAQSTKSNHLPQISSNGLRKYLQTENLLKVLTNSLSLLTSNHTNRIFLQQQSTHHSSTARNKATIEDVELLFKRCLVEFIANNQGHPFQSNNARGNSGAGNAGGQNRVGNVNPGQAKPIKRMVQFLDEEQLLFLAGEQVTNFNDDVDDPPEQDLAPPTWIMSLSRSLDAFDSDVDEAPILHTMFMANLMSEDPIYNEAGTSYDSDIPFEVQDHDNYHDSVYEHHDVHEMQNNIQQDYVVDSKADYTSDSNIISYDQIKILETQLQEKDNAIRNLKAQVSKMNDRSCETYNAKDVTALIEQNECVRVELEKERITKKRTKNEAKTTKPNMEWKRL
ncbi:hypothetical protein Tco_0713225 [Tanacetum coccineum]